MVFAGIIGNQVEVLSDPVTVNRECCQEMPLHRVYVRRFDKAMICESGNLLEKLVMSFRRKQNSKRWETVVYGVSV